MKLTPIPPSPETSFQPIYCAAHSNPKDRAQFVAQLNPPFQFLALLSHASHTTGPPHLSFRVYRKNGWPTGHTESQQRALSGLLHTIPTLFPDLPEDMEGEVIDTHESTERLGAGYRFFFCEAHGAGLESDVILHAQSPWVVYGVEAQDETNPPLFPVYSEQATYGPNQNYIAANPYAPSPTLEEAVEFYRTFVADLDQFQADDLES